MTLTDKCLGPTTQTITGAVYFLGRWVPVDTRKPECLYLLQCTSRLNSTLRKSLLAPRFKTMARPTKKPKRTGRLSSGPDLAAGKSSTTTNESIVVEKAAYKPLLQQQLGPFQNVGPKGGSDDQGQAEGRGRRRRLGAGRAERADARVYTPDRTEFPVEIDRPRARSGVRRRSRRLGPVSPAQRRDE